MRPHHHLHPPHHLPLQMMQELVGQFDESSPLRKLFRSPMDCEFTIDSMLMGHGPVHEVVHNFLVLKKCEKILEALQGDGFEILPIDDGLTIKSSAPRGAEEILPIQYPKTATETSVNIDPSILGEGPIERVLQHTLFITVLQYVESYLKTKGS